MIAMELSGVQATQRIKIKWKSNIKVGYPTYVNHQAKRKTIDVILANKPSGGQPLYYYKNSHVPYNAIRVPFDAEVEFL